jgi:hypothetical protein
MRRVVVCLTVTALALVACSGLALAKNLDGGGGDGLVGTDKKDTVSGGGGNDDLFGKAAADRLSGDSGSDEIRGNDVPDKIFGNNGQDNMYGNAGNDFINAFDEQPNDFVNCGPCENDRAIIDVFTSNRTDTFRNCEIIYLPIPVCGEFCVQSQTPRADLSKLGPEGLEKAVENGLLEEMAR